MEFRFAEIKVKLCDFGLGWQCWPGVGLMGPSTEFLSDTFDNHVAQKPVSDLCHLCHRPKLCGLKQMDHSACLEKEICWLAHHSYTGVGRQGEQEKTFCGFIFKSDFFRLALLGVFGWSPISLRFFVWFPRDLQIMSQSKLKRIFHIKSCHETSSTVRSLVWPTH